MTTQRAYRAAKRRRMNRRCTHALDALAAYACNDPHDLRSSIVDLICDLQHLARREKLDFAAILESADSHCGAEARPDDIEQGSILTETDQ